MACGWQNSCRPWSCNYLQNAGATTYKNFLQLYAKKACKKQYHVEEIIINTKTNKNVYKNIFNYRKSSGVYEFVCEEENVLKRISVLVEEIESIEKNINAGKAYLDIMRQKK